MVHSDSLCTEHIGVAIARRSVQSGIQWPAAQQLEASSPLLAALSLLVRHVSAERSTTHAPFVWCACTRAISNVLTVLCLQVCLCEWMCKSCSAGSTAYALIYAACAVDYRAVHVCEVCLHGNLMCVIAIHFASVRCC
jgi:hypothetical protein